MPLPTRTTLAAALLMALPLTPVMAQQANSTFDLRIRGIPAATLSMTGQETASGYSVAGRLQSAGLVGLFRTMRYDAQVQGTRSGGRFTPSRYTEDADTGKRKSHSVMSYQDGTPQVVEYDPPERDRRGNVVDPASQGGTIDPLTAIWIGLRPTPVAEVCNYDGFMFDGKRRSRVSLSNPRAQGDAILCTGRYERLAGFSDREMAEKTVFNFTMTYVPAGQGVMQVTQISMDTLYGAAVLTRR
ncbi:hypothetical protein CG51_06160 [Haematobacter missouriensis]|uniref:DUF3108 domain-containing protein n=1 Tax=Haematobacter missouriensis TaxID=366616 RepID=A0A212APZ5_9RHOB|nr:DUF3108 domain-containing protein [Haematobacter missouriensis]KFI30995.1 hypothetical protein CG51_06160 [Haematobacter missouriensis]OWJ73935.1 DUF3108 domain-containing protein [Haematobacter missouriensis]OWJ83529.1 DUF3108 domain-containing protein [Haematobacter missouriensis]